MDVAAEQFSVTPRLIARIGITAGDDEPIQAIALRCQIRIEPLRRPYSDEEAEGLVDLFGPRQDGLVAGCVHELVELLGC